MAAADKADANELAADRQQRLADERKRDAEDTIDIVITSTKPIQDQTFAYIDEDLRLREGLSGFLRSRLDHAAGCIRITPSAWRAFSGNSSAGNNVSSL